MRIRQRIARKPRSNNTGFDMDYYEAEFTAEDLPEEIKTKLGPAKQAMLLQFLCSRQITVDLVEGEYISTDQAKVRIQAMQQFMSNLGLNINEFKLW